MFLNKIKSGESGILLYGITPQKRKQFLKELLKLLKRL
jgi:hypothetical protein